MVSVSEKRDFLVWMINNVTFQRREIVWILNYLINHETILANVHVVEQAHQTARGLIIRDSTQEEEPIVLSLQGKEFTNSDQIFHEIRLHWKHPLYLECIFPNSWQNLQYITVLEDNPAWSWNDSVRPEIIQEVEYFIEKEELEAKITLLYLQIDQALENNDKEAFLELSDEVNRLQMLLKEKVLLNS